MANYINITQSMFFDREKVVAAMDRKTKKVLSSAGAFSRTTMQRGMRKRKAISAPGDYPSAHKGSLRRLIYFGYDEQNQSVAVGPTLFAGSKNVGSKTVPQLLNEGGTAPGKAFTVLRGRGKKKRFIRVNKAAKALRYRPRPFVALTLPKAAAKLAENMEKFEFA